MEMLSGWITKQFLKRKIIEAEKQEIYKIGLDIILADIINFSIIVILGAVLDSFIYSCIYLLLFWTVRRHCGGFHAKTYSRCRIVTIGTFLAVVLINNIINANLIIYAALCDIITIATMILLAPIHHPNKDLTLSEVKANKFFSLITTLFFVTISLILLVMGKKEGLVISLTLLAITILMYIGLLTNRKEGLKDVEYSR